MGTEENKEAVVAYWGAGVWGAHRELVRSCEGLGGRSGDQEARQREAMKSWARQWGQSGRGGAGKRCKGGEAACGELRGAEGLAPSLTKWVTLGR